MSQPNSSHAPTLVTRDGATLPDGWQLLNDADDASGDGPYVLGFERALRELDGLNDRNSIIATAPLLERIGVRVQPADDVRLLEPFLDRIALVEVAFPGYRDGRGYSTARILREDLGFTGIIRAVGDVLRDQLHHMIRCGFDEFVVKDADPAEAIAAAAKRFSVAYQGAADGQSPAWQRRLNRETVTP